MSKKGGNSQIVGFRYSLGVLFGLARGPLDDLVQINVNDVMAYQFHGFTSSIGANRDFTINQPDLFGGDDKEGGIDGPARLMMGAPDQVRQDAIADLIGGNVSNWRGKAIVYFNGLICSNNPYPKPWKFRVQRSLSGWYGGTAWYPNEARIGMNDGEGEIRAMNPAHIIYECLTNPVWGRGLPPAALDEPSFISAANTLCDESFGICLLWSRAQSLGDFIQLVINHAGGVMYVDRSTGLITIKLLRQDYDVDTLPVFDYNSGLIQIQDDTSTTPDAAPNEIIVNYIEPVTGDKRQTRIQNLAAIQANNDLVSLTVDYIGCPTQDLAARLAQRDMQTQASGLKRYTLKMDRRARKITPGSVFKLSAPERDINGMIVRAGNIEQASITDRTLKIVVVQDVFALQDNVYTQTVISAWVPPDSTMLPVDIRRVWEINYRDVVRALNAADLAQVTEDEGDIVTVGKRPSGLSVSYELNTHPGAGFAAFDDHGQFPWTPTGTLDISMGYYDTGNPDIGDTPIQLDNAVELRSVLVGGVAWVGDELVQITNVDVDNATIAIKRGTVDTVPARHAAGTRVWFAESAQGADGIEYTTGEDVSVKMLTRTNAGILDESLAPTDIYTIVGRQGRPYPPGALTINGTRFGDALATSVVPLAFDGADRDRIAQADHVLAHEEGPTGPEPGTTYTYRFYDGATLLRTVASLTSPAFTYDGTMYSADGSPTFLGVELESERDGLVSFQKYQFILNLSGGTAGGGFGFAFGRHFGGA